MLLAGTAPALGGYREPQAMMLGVVLLVVWAMSGRGYFWPIWPILGFALFLGWQAFNVLGPQAPDGSRRRDRDR